MRIKSLFLSTSLCSFFLVCCTPVQTRYNIKDKNIANDTTTHKTTEQIQLRTQIIVEQKEPEKPIEIPTKDTLLIALYPEQINTNDKITTDISRANELFESKDYKNALELYRFIIPKIDMTNPYYWDLRLRYEECKILLGKIDEGIEGIEFLLTLIKQNNPAKETALAHFVRILCQNNKKQKAKLYFNILTKDFPNSQYIKELENLHCFSVSSPSSGGRNPERQNSPPHKKKHGGEYPAVQ